ncbi:MAG TPA: hypothetical protein VIO61_13640 [Anaerolineaceae bacterium]
MKRITFLILLLSIAIIFIMAGCSSASEQIGTPVQTNTRHAPVSTPMPTRIPTVVVTPTAEAPHPKEYPAAVEKARQALAKRLAVLPEFILVVSADEVEWPDGCLGVRSPGMMCTAVIVPGYRVVFAANQEQYTYRTNLDGTILVAELMTLPRTANVLVEWTILGETCQKAQILQQGVRTGSCERLPEQLKPFTKPERLRELNTFVSTFQSFTGQTYVGLVGLEGSGNQKATVEEQRSLAEWARFVSLEAKGIQVKEAITYKRDGGIAGFCDSIEIGVGGFAYSNTCKKPGSLVMSRLTSVQLEQMYQWIDKFDRFEWVQKDPAVADRMTIQLFFEGRGTATATESQKKEIIAFAQNLFRDK